jgi:hypothetical protein
MGRVTQAEADRATQIARNIDGVRRVVRSFEIITEEELRQLVPQLGRPAPARAPAPVTPAAPAAAPAAPAPDTTAPAVPQPAAPRSAVPTPLPPATPAR